MRKNIWKNIAKSFNIPLGREFTIEEFFNLGTYKFTENGLECVDHDELPYSDVLSQILSGGLSIVPKPWKPNVGDKYYYVEESINRELYIDTAKWNNDITDYSAYYCGNCFASEEEAEAQKYTLRSTLCKYYNEKED